MAANVLDVCRGLDVASDARVARSSRQRAGRRTAWRWILLGGLMVGASALALQLAQSAAPDSEPAIAGIPESASIYFKATQAVVDDEALQSITAIARAARANPMPIAVTPFAGLPGRRDQSSVLARKRAAQVREALVLAGVPRVRIIIVSPAFVANDLQRVEITLVRGARVFPAPAEATGI